jgi:hypothetical protein
MLENTSMTKSSGQELLNLASCMGLGPLNRRFGILETFPSFPDPRVEWVFRDPSYTKYCKGSFILGINYTPNRVALIKIQLRDRFRHDFHNLIP